MAERKPSGLTSALFLTLAALLAFSGCIKGELVIYGSDAEGPEAGDRMPQKLSECFSDIVSPLTERLGWDLRVVKKLGPNYYVAMATWQSDERERVSVAALYDNIGDGTMHRLLENGPRVEDPPDPNPVQVTNCIADLTERNYYIVYGWVLDPAVASFSLRVSDGRETTVAATTHAYFCAVLGPVLPSQPAVTVEQATAWDADGQVLAQWSPGS